MKGSPGGLPPSPGGGLWAGGGEEHAHPSPLAVRRSPAPAGVFCKVVSFPGGGGGASLFVSRRPPCKKRALFLLPREALGLPFRDSVCV